MTAASLALGVVLGMAAGYAAYRLRALTATGAVAAAATGALTFAFGGVGAALLLLTFFVSSSLLSRVGAAAKVDLGSTFEKDARRDEVQVLANGGVAALMAVAYGLSGSAAAWVAMAGSLAAVNADTWGTELGVLARARPIRLTDGRRVERGTSGAVSLEGTLAALAGAGLVGGLAGMLAGSAALGVAVTVGGLAGSIVDSLLGATLQGVFECPVCGKETERYPVHTCGTPTRPIRGWRWLRNDAVNLGAALAGALVSVGVWSIL